MNTPQCQPIDRVLEAAIVVAWRDLIAPGDSGIVHVEYDFGVKGNITFLQVWLSQTRGTWHLVCSSLGSRGDGDIQLANGYRSEQLAETLSSVLHHQNEFLPPPKLGRQGLLQITEPDAKEYTIAGAIIDQALGQPKSDVTRALM